MPKDTDERVHRPLSLAQQKQNEHMFVIQPLSSPSFEMMSSCLGACQILANQAAQVIRPAHAQLRRPLVHSRNLLRRVLEPDEADVRRRIARQITDADRIEAADVVFNNDGTPEELHNQVIAWWGEYEKGL